MLGQAHTPRRRLRALGLAAVAGAVLTMPAVGGADPTQTADALRQENADLASRSRAAVLSIYALDSQLARTEARVVALQARSERLRAEQASLGRQLRVAQSGLKIAQRRVAARLRLLYEQGDVSAVEVVLGSKTLDEVLTGLESLDRVASQDRAVLLEVRDARTRLSNASRELSAREKRLAAATRDAQAAAAALERAEAERRATVARLAEQRDLNAAQIERLEAEALAAQARVQQLAPSTPAAASAAAWPPASGVPGGQSAEAGRAITVTATGYALGGETATGLPAGWGVVAVDPGLIPLGTRMTIPGYGRGVAADTGGAVGGATIDLWFPTEAQARAWGRRTVTIVLH